MNDIWTYCFSVGGIIATIYYFYLIESLHDRQRLRKRSPEFFNLKLNISELGEKGKLDVILKDYEISNREIERRDHITLLIGSILITGSFLTLLYYLSNFKELTNIRSIFALTSIFSFSLWLFFLHYTSVRLDNLSYSRVRTIEEALREKFGYEFGIHWYLHRKIHGDKWISWRRKFWGIIFGLLSFAWLLSSFL